MPKQAVHFYFVLVFSFSFSSTVRREAHGGENTVAVLVLADKSQNVNYFINL